MSPQGFMNLCQYPGCTNSYWSEKPRPFCDDHAVPPDMGDIPFDLVEVGGHLVRVPDVVEPRERLDSPEFWSAYFARHPEELWPVLTELERGHGNR